MHFKDTDIEGGANELSLNEAKKYFQNIKIRHLYEKQSCYFTKRHYRSRRKSDY
ncbi:hypothetical protein [Xenorhabdus griffiniae]|uniref:hypothetical protein n=1 Tax=Xenorhabdus griffiniae TaxID=351672 RepID=UPI003BAF92BB